MCESVVYPCFGLWARVYDGEGKGWGVQSMVCSFIGIPLVIHGNGDDEKRASGHVLEYD